VECVGAGRLFPAPTTGEGSSIGGVLGGVGKNHMGRISVIVHFC